jgi:hypothetical protein
MRLILSTRKLAGAALMCRYRQILCILALRWLSQLRSKTWLQFSTGEIQLDGVVQTIDLANSRFVLNVMSFTLASNKRRPSQLLNPKLYALVPEQRCAAPATHLQN